MLRLLHLDASARPGIGGIHEHGSLTRRLTHRFVHQWHVHRPGDTIVYRDIGREPPAPVSHAWIQAAFAPGGGQQGWMEDTLAESDALVEELVAADVLVLGAPLYNFGMPAPLKAWIDNIVRVGRTVAFAPEQPDNPYVPLLADRPRSAVVLSARGGSGFDPGGELAHMNHLEPGLRTALEFIGITDIRNAAIEFQEEGGERLAESIRKAESAVDGFVETLLSRIAMQREPIAESGRLVQA